MPIFPHRFFVRKSANVLQAWPWPGDEKGLALRQRCDGLATSRESNVRVPIGDHREHLKLRDLRSPSPKQNTTSPCKSANTLRASSMGVWNREKADAADSCGNGRLPMAALSTKAVMPKRVSRGSYRPIADLRQTVKRTLQRLASATAFCRSPLRETRRRSRAPPSPDFVTK